MPVEVIALIFTLPVVIVIWLLVFNKGANRLSVYRIVLTDQNILVSRSDDETQMNWSDISDVKISKYLNNYVCLMSSDNRRLEFDYYAFDNNQRATIFAYLQKYVGYSG